MKEPDWCVVLPSGGSRKFWWGGGFEAQNLKNSDVFTKIESDFSAEIGNSNVFFAQIQVVSKKTKNKTKKKVFTKIESDFSTEIVFSPKFRWSPKKKKKKKKKKKVFTKIETDFSAEIGTSNVFFAQNQVVSKKKKRSSPKLRLIFCRIRYV